MGTAKAISRALVYFPFDDMNRATLTGASGRALRPKLDAREQALKEKAPGQGKEAGKAKRVRDEARGEQQSPPTARTTSSISALAALHDPCGALLEAA